MGAANMMVNIEARLSLNSDKGFLCSGYLRSVTSWLSDLDLFLICLSEKNACNHISFKGFG